MQIVRILLPVVLILLPAANGFAQMACVIESRANLLSSPSVTGSYVVLQVPHHFPLEVLEEENGFLYVRDYSGRDSWIEKSQVGPADGVIVQAGVANVRSGPGPEQTLLFQARQGVTFRVIEARSDWLHVEHDSGKTGWIYQPLVWGH